MNNVRFNIQQEMWSGAVALRIAMKTESGMVIAKNMTYEPVKPGEHTEPLLSLTQAEAQSLADSLYEAGIRPTAAAGSAGQLDAIKYHLEDLRTLVFKRPTP